MKIRIVKLLNLIRFRIIGTILLSITITVNAIEATIPNIEYIFIIPILVMGTILLWPLIRGRPTFPIAYGACSFGYPLTFF